MLCNLPALSLGHAAEFKTQLHIFHNRLKGHQGQLLEYHADFRVYALPLPAVVHNLSFGLLLQSCNDVEQHGLAAAPRSQDYQEFAVVYIKAHILYGCKISLIAEKRLGYPIYFHSFI